MAGQRPASPTARDRFDAKVDRSGGHDACWPWRAGKGTGGYGAFHPRKGDTVGAHRFALEMHLGRRLLPSEEACHTCDNRPCCNPAHLYPGTRADNVADAVVRDRLTRGSARGDTSLLEGQVMDLRNRFAAGERLADLAADFHIGKATASRIVNGRSWTHVGGALRHGKRRYPIDHQRKAA